MKLYRTTTIECGVQDIPSMEMGDVFEFELNDGQTVRAMAVKKDDEAVDFITVDCLDGCIMPMNGRLTSEGGYDASDLRKRLNGEVLELFPDDIRDAMVPVYKDDLLTLPSEMEVFGERIYSIEDSGDEMLEPMKERRNRIALDGIYGWPIDFWLRDAASAYGFACVGSDGNAGILTATVSFGVRPRFRIADR